MSPFKDGVQYIKLCDDAFLIENFIDQDKFLHIQDMLLKFNDSDWTGADESPYFKGRVTFPLPEGQWIREKIQEVVKEEYIVGHTSSFMRMLKGGFHGAHSDNADFIEKRKASSMLKENEPYEIVDDTRWGIVMYFNEFEGGSLRYTKQNVLYHPKPNDFVIHSAEDHCEHEVTELKSEIRLSHANYLYQNIKVPSWFVKNKNE